ncbi:MAG TPA: OmpA family protein [Acidobacteriota bacterium]
MKRIQPLFLFLLLFSLVSLAPVLAQVNPDKDTVENIHQTVPVSIQKHTIKGVIVHRDADSFILRDEGGIDRTVKLTAETQVREKKSGLFSRPKNYATTQLLRGLNLEVEGRGDSSGAMVAQKIKLSDRDLKVAQTVDTRVTPVEERLGQSEQNAQRLSGQIEELNAVSNAARGGARAAQETADTALSRAQDAMSRADNAVSGVQAANSRITSLDEYDAQKSIIVNFKVGSFVLSPDAKAALDQIATEAKTEKGYVIEVTGFASADGSESLNRRLSQRRADAVVRYLAENHMIPLRRIITPFGYGESQPVADNSTREGRKQNRRVEVKILVNRGLVASAEMHSSSQ